MNRYYHIYTENNPRSFNESSDRINSLKCNIVANSGISEEQFVKKYPNYQLKNAAFKNYCNLMK